MYSPSELSRRAIQRDLALAAGGAALLAGRERIYLAVTQIKRKVTKGWAALRQPRTIRDMRAPLAITIGIIGQLDRACDRN
jgi:hypothetical protein